MSALGSRRRRAHAFVGLAVGVATTLATTAVPGAASAAPAGPDQVLVWNQIAAEELIRVKGQAPPTSLLHLAMVHGAVYDAVNAITGDHQPYLVSAAADPSASIDAAAATAAWRVLRHLLTDRATQLDARYGESLAAIPDGDAETGGVAAGVKAAEAMITARTDDGRNGSPLFTVGTAAGQWRTTPPTGNNFRWVGQVKPFIVDDAARFATDGPLPLTSSAYATEFDQVKSLGRATGSTRTPDQTAQALFWADHTLAMWTRIFQQISTRQELSGAENARYFGMLYLTGADSVIACFQDKERHRFWRPQTAIREAATDGNPATTAEPGWTPLVANPPYPDHPSGANCVASAFVHTLQDFFGTNRVPFSATHAGSGVTRSFTHLSHALNEVRLARVYAGLHFMTADAAGVNIGRKAAAYREHHALGPA